MSDIAAKAHILNLSAKNSSKNLAQTQNNTATQSLNKAEFNDDTQSFLSTLIQALDENNEFLTQNLMINEKEFLKQLKQFDDSLLLADFEQETKLALFESLSFMELLALLDTMKIQSTELNFAQLSKKSQELLKTEQNFHNLKKAENLGELLILAKELDLNLTHIKIAPLFDLKNNFKNLDKAEFFNNSTQSVLKDYVQNKIANIIAKFENKEIKNENLKSKKAESLLSKTLQNLDLKANETNTEKIINTKIKENKTQPQKNQEFKPEHKIKNELPLNELIQTKKEVKNEKTNTELKISKEENTKEQNTKQRLKQEPLIQNNEQSKEPQLKAKDLVLTMKNEEKIQENILSKQEQKFATPKLEKERKNDEKKAENSLPEKSSIKNEKILNENVNTELPKENTLKQKAKNQVQENNLAYNKYENTQITEKQSPKTQNIIQKQDEENKNTHFMPNLNNFNKENNKNTESKNLFENTVNKFSKEHLNTQNSSENKSQNNEQSKDLSQEKKEILKENKENTLNKNENNELNSLLKNLAQLSKTELKSQINIKETLQYFAQDLKEQMSNYKAPITKLNITLNPSNLGEVEVTLIQRGNNLHIHFNSNANAMNLFMQHQAEFKNSLVNMGFTGLEMNFSEQGKKEQNSHQNKKNSSFRTENEVENLNEKLELILVKYF